LNSSQEIDRLNENISELVLSNELQEDLQDKLQDDLAEQKLRCEALSQNNAELINKYESENEKVTNLQSQFTNLESQFSSLQVSHDTLEFAVENNLNRQVQPDGVAQPDDLLEMQNITFSSTLAELECTICCENNNQKSCFAVIFKNIQPEFPRLLRFFSSAG
jgi:predicted nuclease with TOPRIM domain